MASIQSRKIAVLSILSFQTVLIILFSIFVEYDAVADPRSQEKPDNGTTTFDAQYPSK